MLVYKEAVFAKTEREFTRSLFKPLKTERGFVTCSGYYKENKNSYTLYNGVKEKLLNVKKTHEDIRFIKGVYDI